MKNVNIGVHVIRNISKINHTNYTIKENKNGTNEYN